MVTSTSQGIRISVETFYQHKTSDLVLRHFVFAYRISITNDSAQDVQLLSRHWLITDGMGIAREVQGEGVVGEQPMIKSASTYEYVSGCDFATEIGKMSGSYQMQRTDGSLFEVAIPEFVMIYPFKLN